MSERSIFLEALEIEDLSLRDEYLDRACDGDPGLRARVEQLLTAQARSGHFMADPAGVPPTATAPPAPEAPGERIGPYKLLQEIGQGGMGTVYMAQQDEPVRRTVALKIIRTGMDTRSVLARFEAERQALALMDHPNIARVLDVGTTDSGLPYFVMELVRGVPITRFCDEHQLSVSERLELFVPVCQAIQHAHQKGIIHRDIKPSNVLVAMYDDRPVPKVIDFGIAKAISQKLTDRTLFTLFGAVVGTLEYMSPEQARLNQLDVDTRSDVYSLGVLLYELLTGGTPLDRVRLKSAALDEVLRLIREEDVPRPSTRLSTVQTLPRIAAERKSDPGRLGRLLRGEIDWIVMKALEKDRARRYETANGLARDVERFLKDEPVEACPPTFAYRLHKLYRRNRTAVGVVAAFLLLLSAATATATVLAVRAAQSERRAEEALRHALRNEAEANAQRAAAEAATLKADDERRRAEREKQSAQAVRDFLQDDLLRQASPLQQAEMRRTEGGEYAVKRDPTVRELLDRAAERLSPDRIEARFPSMPVVQAEVLATVGETYMDLQEDAKGTEMLRRAVETYRKSLGDDDPATLQARQDFATAVFWNGAWSDRADDVREGLAMMEAVCEGRIRVQGRDHPDVFTARERLGGMYLHSKAKDPIPFFSQLRDDALRVFGPTGFHTLYAIHDLASAYLRAGRPAEAVTLLESVRAALRSAPGTYPLDHPYVVRGHCTLARAYEMAGRPDRAIEILRPIYDHLDRNPERLPASLFEVILYLTSSLKKAGRLPEAAEILKRGEQLADSTGRYRRMAWGERHQLAWVFMSSETPEAALPLFRANVDASDTLERKATSLQSIFQFHERRGRHEDALTEIRNALEVYLEANGPDFRNFQTGLCRIRMGRTLVRLGKPAEAEPVLRAGYEDMVDHLAEIPEYDKAQVPGARTEILALYRSTKRPEAVRPWAEAVVPKAEATARSLQGKPGIAPWIVAEAVRVLGLAYLDAGRPEDAARAHDEAVRKFAETGWPDDPDVVETLRGLRSEVFAAGHQDLGRSMRQAMIESLTKLPDPPRDLLARVYFSAGFQELNQARRPDDAAPYFRKAVEALEGVAPDSWNLVKYRLFLGDALARGNHHAEAEPLLQRVFEESVAHLAQAPPWEKHFPNTAARFLTRICRDAGRQEDAARWEAEGAKYPARTPAPAAAP